LFFFLLGALLLKELVVEALDAAPKVDVPPNENPVVPAAGAGAPKAPPNAPVAPGAGAGVVKLNVDGAGAGAPNKPEPVLVDAAGAGAPNKLVGWVAGCDALLALALSPAAFRY
jgi:hypothetical protein